MKISILVSSIILTSFSLHAVAEINPFNDVTPSSVAGAIGDIAIIDNGLIQLGINDAGQLNVPGSLSAGGTPVVGLRYLPTNNESTGPGCECEGWGVADSISGISGGANETFGGAFGLTVESFDFDPSNAVSVTNVGDIFRVTHNYHPSESPNLYQVDVTIENISPNPVNVLYRRVMDWDIEPTPFDEYSTVVTNGANDIIFTSNDGFASSDPLAGPSDIGFVGDFIDAGPSDHGALFDFDFGNLPAGGVKRFTTFYGAAENEFGALSALATVEAEAYSFGQSSISDPTIGTPNTFIFAFGNVKGKTVTLRKYVAVGRVKDLNSDGVAEIAALSVNARGVVQVSIKDPITGKSIKTLKFFKSGFDSAGFDPVDMSIQGRVITVLAIDNNTGDVIAKSLNSKTNAAAYPKKSISFPSVI